MGGFVTVPTLLGLPLAVLLSHPRGLVRSMVKVSCVKTVENISGLDPGLLLGTLSLLVHAALSPEEGTQHHPSSTTQPRPPAVGRTSRVSKGVILYWEDLHAQEYHYTTTPLEQLCCFYNIVRVLYNRLGLCLRTDDRIKEYSALDPCFCVF